MKPSRDRFVCNEFIKNKCFESSHLRGAVVMALRVWFVFILFKQQKRKKGGKKVHKRVWRQSDRISARGFYSRE